MISKKNPHDDFFKLVFSKKEVVIDFLNEFLNLNITTLSPLPTEKNTKYKKYFLDLAFKTKYKNSDAQIYIVFEHKSYPDKMVYFQILNYALSIWEEEKENLTPIIPIIFYHGRENFKLKDNFAKLFAVDTPFNLNFPFKIFNVREIDDKKLLTCKNLFLCASIYTMKHIFDSINELKKIALFFSKMSKEDYFLIVEYISSFKDEKEENIIEEIVPKEIKMTILEKWQKEGFEKGLQKGLEQGIKEGIQKGIQEGIQKGIQEGIKKGEEKGIIKGKILAFYDLGLSKKEIANKLNLTIDEIENILKEK